MFKSIESEKLSDKVAFQITKMIENGELKPGDKLPPEISLAENFGVSRGIVREGLSILQHKGYIRRKPKEGTFIRELPESGKEESIISTLKKAPYKDLIEMREALEQKVVELAIIKATDQEIKEIEAFLEKASVTELDDLLLNSTFHLRLAQLSKNELLINFMENYYELIRELGKNSFTSQKRKDQVLKEHKEIVQAIMDRDVEAAKEAVLRHLAMVKQTIDSMDMKDWKL